jgi:heat shock protein HslJ
MLLALLLLAACGGSPGMNGDEGGAEAVAAETWQLDTLRGQPLLEGTTLTAVFDESMVHGTAGCNRYGGSYTLRNEGLEISELENNEEACLEPEGIMQQEGTYLETLRAVRGYDVNGGELALTDEAGETILAFSPYRLAGTEWEMEELDGREPPGGVRPTLEFGDADIGGFAGCNTYSGQYAVEHAARLLIGNLVWTEMACLEPEGVMDFEARYLEVLQTVTAYDLGGSGRLLLRAGEGVVPMVFRLTEK